MKIRILYFSQIRKAAGGREEEVVELPPGATLSDAITEAERLHPAISSYTKTLLVTRNEEWTRRGTVLEENDVIGLMPPVSGG